MTHRVWLVSALLLAACDEALVPEPLAPDSFEPLVSPVTLDLSATPAFADERGGGIFVDLAGRVVRVRPNSERGVLEPHPQNAVLPGPATAVFPLGPYNAMVATSRGVFVVDQGWLIAPSWQASLDAAGLRAASLGEGGVAWLAHDTGLFRLEAGFLAEFKLGEESLPGVTAMGQGPTLDGTPGLWFARDGKLFAAAQTSRTQFSVSESGLSGDVLAGGVLGIAGIGASPESGGEVWLITAQGLLLYTGTSWRFYTLGKTPKRLYGSGRYAWMQAGDSLYRYEGDTRRWSEVTGLAAAPALLAVDAAGSAWVRVGTQTLSLSANAAPRIRGLYQGARVFDGQLVIEAAVPATPPLTSLTWAFDGADAQEVELTGVVAGAGPTAGQLFYSLGGLEPGDRPRPVSFAGLADGRHVLTVTATSEERTSIRRVHFDFLGAATATISFAEAIAPLNQERCAKCHSAGTEPELTTYAQWQANAAAIAAAVRERRMPADGPMDPASIEAVIRWVNGGALP